ncbi:MAG: Mu-like prophage major head subunit gpT family protein [Azonexus sp.]|jgi:phage major head subunit gpT-like protein|nr:Mu-like prophage major head subunit gpT family protein [Azonexus sp.]
MNITTDTLRLLTQGFNAAFTRGFESLPSSHGLISMTIPSTSDAENYGWMKDLPGMREWVGQRVYNNLELTDAYIRNKHWEHTIAVNRNDIEDDKLGLYGNRFSMQGEIVARHPDDLVWGLLKDGFTVTGFDGQPFFDPDHNGWSRDKQEVSWSNLLGNASTAPWFVMDLSRAWMKPLIFQNRKSPEFVARTRADDPSVFDNNTYLYGADARYNAAFGFHQLAVGVKDALTAANFDTARKMLAGQFRPDGSPLGVMATHLICGPANETAARQLLNAEFIEGSTNIWKGAVQLHVSPWLE